MLSVSDDVNTLIPSVNFGTGRRRPASSLRAECREADPSRCFGMEESTAFDNGASAVREDITLCLGGATEFNSNGASAVRDDMTPCFGRATEFNRNAVGSSSPELSVSTSHVELDPVSECRQSDVSPPLESPTSKYRLRILLANSLAKGCVSVTRFEEELL